MTTIQNGTLTAWPWPTAAPPPNIPPADVTSGWEATYSRPVFQNINFNNVRIPKGLNAKFINCTFNGYTSVKMTTNITSGGQTTTDPSAGEYLGPADDLRLLQLRQYHADRLQQFHRLRAG